MHAGDSYFDLVKEVSARGFPICISFRRKVANINVRSGSKHHGLEQDQADLIGSIIAFNCSQKILEIQQWQIWGPHTAHNSGAAR